MIHEEFEELAENEFLEFNRIPEEERLSSYKDLCALLYLEKKFGPSKTNSDIIIGAEHDIFYFDLGVEKLTNEDVIYLARCGVHWSSECDSLAMFT